MKYYISALLLSLTLIRSLPVLASNDSCMLNGYSRTAIYAREAQIANAIRTNDNKALIKLIDFPLQINLTSGKRTIKSVKGFLRFQKEIIVAQDAKTVIKYLTTKSHDVICRADGVGLMNGGMWLSPSNLKIMTLNTGAIPNARITPDKPYGNPVSSITNKQVLTHFAHLYNKMRRDKTIDGSALFVMRISPKMYQLNSETNAGNISLYKADINNSGTPDYILSYDNQGSMSTDGIRFIGTIKANRLVPIDFQKTIKRNFNIDMSKWYLFHSTPFLTKKEGVYMNYKSNGITCTYIWKKDKISLITNDSVDCVNKLDTKKY